MLTTYNNYCQMTIVVVLAVCLLNCRGLATPTCDVPTDLTNYQNVTTPTEPKDGGPGSRTIIVGTFVQIIYWACQTVYCCTPVCNCSTASLQNTCPHPQSATTKSCYLQSYQLRFYQYMCSPNYVTNTKTGICEPASLMKSRAPTLEPSSSRAINTTVAPPQAVVLLQQQSALPNYTIILIASVVASIVFLLLLILLILCCIFFVFGKRRAEKKKKEPVIFVVSADLEKGEKAMQAEREQQPPIYDEIGDNLGIYKAVEEEEKEKVVGELGRVRASPNVYEPLPPQEADLKPVKSPGIGDQSCPELLDNSINDLLYSSTA